MIFKRSLPLFGAGVVGIVALNVALFPVLAEQAAQAPEMAAMSPGSLVLLASLQSSVLLAIMVAVGAALAPPLGLRSHVAECSALGTPMWAGLRREWGPALGLGVAIFALIAAFDVGTQGFLPPPKEGGAEVAQALAHTTPASVLASLLYGGITEELLLRWGLMTLFVWLGWRVWQGGDGPPRPAVVWGANIVAALLFGALHLPTTAVLYDLTPFVVGRALFLNGVAGVAAGWLYWRYSLEAAMMAHAMSHVGLTVLALGLPLLAAG